MGFDFSAYYARDPEHLIRVMSTNPTYLRTAEDGAVTNYRDWQIPLGRRFRALKLWFYLLDVGVDGLQARLRRDLVNAQWLKEQVDAAPDWERLAPVPLQTVCVRHVPKVIAGDEPALTAHNLAIARSINDSGAAYLTPSDLKGRQMLRLSIGAETTERRHVEALWRALQAAASSLSGASAFRARADGQVSLGAAGSRRRRARSGSLPRARRGAARVWRRACARAATGRGLPNWSSPRMVSAGGVGAGGSSAQSSPRPAALRSPRGPGDPPDPAPDPLPASSG